MRIIRFFSKPEYQDLGQPDIIKKFLPDWYKESESYIVGKDNKQEPGLKKCMPFLDTLLTGYALVTPVDIFVSKNDDGTLNIGWNSPDIFKNFISERPKDSGSKMPRPIGHYPNHLVFRGFWGIKTPKGWSVLITHPLNRHDLPFTTASGIMDTDKYSTSGNIPFFIKEDFTGMIPAGTPFAQLIPIKRSKWGSIKNDKGITYLEDLQGGIVRQSRTSYKRIFWQRKDYK